MFRSNLSVKTFRSKLSAKRFGQNLLAPMPFTISINPKPQTINPKPPVPGGLPPCIHNPHPSLIPIKCLLQNAQLFLVPHDVFHRFPLVLILLSHPVPLSGSIAGPAGDLQQIKFEDSNCLNSTCFQALPQFFQHLDEVCCCWPSLFLPLLLEEDSIPSRVYSLGLKV